MTPGERTSLLQIVDANANRASEGLRVAEEYCRFVLGDRFLAERCKCLRHGLVQAVAPLPLPVRLAARNTQGDVGTQYETAAVRATPREVAVAGLKRAQQALRSLAEFAGPLAPEVAAACEQLRYHSYTLEKAVVNEAHCQELLAQARLYVLTDGCRSEAELTQRVEALIAGGAAIIQLRDKRLTDRELLGRARAASAATRGRGVLFCLNDRPDLAVLCQADAVHVGQEELSVADVRRVVGPEMLVGVSTHSLAQAQQAVLEGASYLGVGPVFPSDTKSFAAHMGTGLLAQVAREIALPAFAIGGITAANVGEVLAAGFSRIAVSGAVCGAPHPGNAARELANLLAVPPAAT